MNRHIGTRFEGYLATEHLEHLTGKPFSISIGWEDGRIRDPGDYIGKHRNDGLHNGSVIWSNLFERFRRITASGPYGEVEESV